MRWLEAHMDYQGDECLPWPFAKGGGGYGNIWMNGVQMVASRVMTFLAYGEAPSQDLQAAHSCGNGHLGCVNPRHLRWATVSDNQADRITHGTVLRGSRNLRAKLTEADVVEIREVYASGEFMQSEIAEEVGVTRSVISHIVTRRTWNHI